MAYRVLSSAAYCVETLTADQDAIGSQDADEPIADCPELRRVFPVAEPACSTRD
jgi:hypothetical protein